jgi:hypothetical protein
MNSDMSQTSGGCYHSECDCDDSDVGCTIYLLAEWSRGDQTNKAKYYSHKGDRACKGVNLHK